MRRTSLFAIAAWTLMLLSGAPEARAQAEPRQPGERSDNIIRRYNTGLRYALAPGLFIPLNGERVGFSVTGDVRYGVGFGPLIVAPGLRLAGYFPSDVTILTALASARVTVPLGRVGPYAFGGLGPGWASDPSEAGLAYMLGGGVHAFVGENFALGVEVTYQAITGTAFESLFLGPSILLGF